MARRSEQLERQADRTRAQLADTLEELRTRISPSQVVDELMDYTREGGAAEFARNLGRDVRAHPLPTTLIVAGLGWLFMGNARPTQGDGAGEEASGTAEAIADRASEASEKIDRAGATQAVKGAANSLGQSASDSGRLFLQFCREQPIFMAGLGLAAGAVVGALLSSTETGKRLAEEASAAATDSAERMATRRPDKAKDVARAETEVGSAAREGLGAPPAEPQTGSRPITHH